MIELTKFQELYYRHSNIIDIHNVKRCKHCGVGITTPHTSHLTMGTSSVNWGECDNCSTSNDEDLDSKLLRELKEMETNNEHDM